MSSFRWLAGAGLLGSQIHRSSVKHQFADVIVGLTGGKTKGSSDLNFRQVRELAQKNHADFPLDRLVFGKCNKPAPSVRYAYDAAAVLNIEILGDPQYSRLPSSVHYSTGGAVCPINFCTNWFVTFSRGKVGEFFSVELDGELKRIERTRNSETTYVQKSFVQYWAAGYLLGAYYKGLPKLACPPWGR